MANGGDPDTVRQGNERSWKGASRTRRSPSSDGNIEELVGDLGVITFVAGAGG